MIFASESQKQLLKQYLPNVNHLIEAGYINDLLDLLDDKITEVGFYPDYSLNETGLKLQKLYDELFDQN